MVELFNLLAERNVTPNGWCQLFNLHRGIAYTDYLNVYNELNKLESLKMIKAIPGSKERLPIKSFEITSTGLSLLEDVEKLLRKKQKTDKKASLYLEWLDNINKYRMLFPAKVESHIYRTGASELYIKFVYFFENSHYDWDTVILATKEYISNTKDAYGKYPFLQTASNFIRKQNLDKSWKSGLSDWCEQVTAPIDVESTDELNTFAFFGEKVF